MKGIIAWFAGNHVAANLLMLFLILGGLVTGINMKLEVFPEISLDRITITTIYPGASPEEVESAIIQQIEENIAGLAGIKRLTSTIREGMGSVAIEVVKGWDLKKLVSEVEAEVNRISTFPAEAEDPIVQEITRRNQVISLAVYGDIPEWSLKNLAENIKNEITNLPGITLASINGIRRGEIHIEISESTLRRFGLSLGAVADTVRRSSLDMPAGSVKTTGGEILIRTKGRRYHADDYRDVALISRVDGTTVTLGQIATLRDGFEDVDMSARFQGKPAAVINVFSVADQNVLTVAKTVKDYIQTLKPKLPTGVDISFFNDSSDTLKSRIELLLVNMAYGLVLVILLLGFFLKWRLAFWVTLGIPVSFLMGLMLLPQFDVTINMVSLFAFIMVLGIVVDDAIIIGENIFRKHEEGMTPYAGAVEGTVEVGHPVIFSVLTTVAAFSPLMFGSGMMGNMMRCIPWVVILVLMASLVESLLILPAHLVRSREKSVARSENPDSAGFIARGLKRFINGPYAMIVDYCVKWRYATVAAGFMLLILCLGLWFGGWTKFVFFPRVEGDVLQCAITMPVGKPVERTEAVVVQLEEAARNVMDEIDRQRPEGLPSVYKYTSSLIGAQAQMGGPMGGGMTSGGHLAQIMIQLLPSEERDVSSAKLNKMWREAAGPVSDAESISFTSEMHGMGNAIQVNLSMNDYDQLLEAVEDLKRELEKYPGVFDIRDNFLTGKKEMQLKLKPAARSLGLTLNNLASQVRHAFYGAEALRFQRDEDEIKVLVHYPETERRSLGDVEGMRIRTPAGDEVPFGTVAEVKMERGYAVIQRDQRQRIITVYGDVDETVTNANEVRQILAQEYLLKLTAQYPSLRFSMEGEAKEQMEALSDIFQGFIVALFCIYALLAIPFKSFTQPFVVMSAIPFGFVGALIGHILMGFDLSMMSLMGALGLAGVVVNDSLVLVHTANRIRGQGYSAHDAITQAGIMRFRPVILTSLTTFVGLTPMLLERSTQAQFMVPMAVSLGFGVLFATGITLLMIPSLYMILEDGLTVLNKVRGKVAADSVG